MNKEETVSCLNCGREHNIYDSNGKLQEVIHCVCADPKGPSRIEYIPGCGYCYITKRF